MPTTGNSDILVDHAEDTMITRFERKKIDDHPIYGLIIKRSRFLVLIHLENDFLFDGYVVIRKQDITDEHVSDSSEYCEMIMRKEKQWPKIPKRVKDLPVTNWQSFLKKFIGKIIILQNERKGVFIIGKLLSVDKKAASVRYFDACGEWLDVRKIKLADITYMQLGDRYSTYHAKYLVDPDKPVRRISR